MSNKQNFWQLITYNRVEIPVIQRDYAQGREEDKINALRVDFVSDLVSSIKDESSKKIHLGFIYGKLNGKDEKLPVFIPLDGQQRLTTLFLLHWYLIQDLKNDKFKSDTDILKRFSYKIRKSSVKFCEALCDVENRIEISKKSISDTIKNSKWFLNVWLNDSTVKGMLVMLDEIHSQIKDLEIKDVLLRNLQDNLAVSFDFFDLDELNQTDELYVKMNARGKQLSEFEHFKAWLQKYICDKEIKILDANWETKLDKTWLDLFWKNTESFDVDKNIYNAFKQITLLEYIANSEKKDVSESFIQSVNRKEHISFKKFKELEYFNEKTLGFLFKGLDELTNERNIQRYEEWLKNIACIPFINKDEPLNQYFLTTNNDINLPKYVFYYAFLVFVIDERDEKKLNEDSFKKWMRVCRNLIFNTYIQNPKNFIDAINSIHKLSMYKDDVFEFLLKPGSEIDFFSKKQIKEEVAKANLIKENGADLYQKILKFENHEYFNAEINFLLEFANVEGVFNKDEFIFYGERASILFSNEIRNHEDRLLQRALLSVGNYLPRVGPNQTFCLSNADSLRARRDNWQKVLNNQENKLLKKLIKDNLNDISDIESSLKKCIRSYDNVDWMKYIINCPETIEFCEKGFIRWENEGDIKLLKTSRVYGKHAELRSYNFFKNKLKDPFNKDPFKNLEYWENRMSQYEFPCVIFSQWEVGNEKFILEITYKDSSYFVQFFNEEKSRINNTIEKYLKENVWSNHESVFFRKIETQNELKNNLDKLLVDLNSLKL